MYKEHNIFPQGIITTENIPLAGSGTHVQFNLPPYMAARAKIYVIIDGELKEFKNGKPMETPRTGIHRVFKNIKPTVGNVIVIDPAVCKLTLDGETEELIFGTGSKAVKVEVSTYADISFSISDPEQLAIDYLKGKVSDPEEAVFDELKSSLVSAQKYLSKESALVSFVNNVRYEASDLADYITTDLIHKVPWIRIDKCHVYRTILNTDEIVDVINEPYESAKAILDRCITAICDSYQTNVFPAEIAQIMSSWMQSNPGGISESNLCNACNALIALSKKNTPAELLSLVKQYPALLS